MDFGIEKTKEKPDIYSISTDIVPSLKKINNCIKNNPAFLVLFKKDPFTLKAMIILSISTGLGYTGFFYFFRFPWQTIPFIIDGFELFAFSIVVGLWVIAGLVIITLLTLGRTARTHLVLLEVILVGSLGAISTSYMLLRDFNMDFDSGISEYYEVTVKNKNTRGARRRGRSYYLKVDDWIIGSGIKSLKVSSSIYRQYSISDKIKIKQKPGCLGYRWVESIEKLPKQSQ